MAKLPKKLIEECKQKLVDVKTECLNRAKSARKEIVYSDKGGDEGDLTVRALQEAEFLKMNERLRQRLVEIEFALHRIDSGSFGVCEETEEVIEHDRLLAIPWTRLSIEGAEIREDINKVYAR